MKNFILYFILFLTVFTYATPTGDSNQDFCDTNDSTIASIVVTGNPIYWFATNDNSGTPLLETEILTNNTIYYAFDSTDSDAESLAVLINIIENVPAPTGDSPINLCDNGSTLADIPVFNTSGYSEIYWYSTAIQENGTELPISTILEDETTYYAFQGHGDCAIALPVTINLIGIIPAPIGETEQYFCSEDLPTLADLLVENTASYDAIYWTNNTYCLEGQLLSPTTTLIDGTTYYAYQTLDNGCCPDFLAITVHLQNPIPAPTGEELQGFCMNETPTLSNLIIENTVGYDTIYWYANPIPNGAPLDLSTLLVNSGVYYAFQANTGTCINYLTVTVDFMTCLSIDDNQIANFSFKPNPVKDILNIDFDITNNKTTVIIYNIFGSLVYKNDFYQKNGININVSNLDSGVYFINTQVDNKINTKKFVKQ